MRTHKQAEGTALDGVAEILKRDPLGWSLDALLELGGLPEGGITVTSFEFFASNSDHARLAVKFKGVDESDGTTLESIHPECLGPYRTYSGALSIWDDGSYRVDLNDTTPSNP